MNHEVALTRGYILRHSPAQSPQGVEAAVIDIAQDLLLRHLADTGVFRLVAFKGGTALRKLYAGASGRFSTDLDFAVANLRDERAAVADLMAEAIHETELGPFRYEIRVDRGRAKILYTSQFEFVRSSTLESKLDVGPPPWLPPTFRPWVMQPVHSRYGGPLPEIPTVRLEENVAEKIARLNRRTLARDAYDLVWIAKTPGIDLDQALTRRLAILKCWVDIHGLQSTHNRWSPIGDALPFDPERWLRSRRTDDFDDEQIGLLTVPPPDLDELGADLGDFYPWLAHLTSDEERVATGEASRRSDVIHALEELSEGRISGVW